MYVMYIFMLGMYGETARARVLKLNDEIQRVKSPGMGANMTGAVGQAANKAKSFFGFVRYFR